MSNSHTVSATLGVQKNMKQDERQPDDLYCTHPHAVECLLNQTEERFGKIIWECACGRGHIAEVLKSAGYTVFCSDKYIYDYPIDFRHDVIGLDDAPICGGGFDIITNPPFKHCSLFVEKCMNILLPERKLALFLRIQFLESKERHELFKTYPPKTVYIPARRFKVAKDGDPKKFELSNAMCFCWFVWEKGYSGETTVKFIEG